MHQSLGVSSQPFSGEQLRPFYFTMAYEPSEELRKNAVFKIIEILNDDIYNNVLHTSRRVREGRYADSLVWTIDDLFSETKLFIMNRLLAWYGHEDKSEHDRLLRGTDTKLIHAFTQYIYLSSMSGVNRAYGTTNLMIRLPIQDVWKLLSEHVDPENFDSEYIKMDHQLTDDTRHLVKQVLFHHEYIPIQTGDSSEGDNTWDYVAYGEIREDIDYLQRKSDYISELSKWIKEMFVGLSERERYVITERFGLTTGQPRTLQEVGDDLGFTREYIRQVEKRAIRRLRKRFVELPEHHDLRIMADYFLYTNYELAPL